MTNSTRTTRWFKAQQNVEAVELCLQEGHYSTAVAQRLCPPPSSLARWVRQARNSFRERCAYNCCQPGPQGLLA